MSTIKSFLRTVLGARKALQNSPAARYWAACSALATGGAPKVKPEQFARDLVDLGRDERDVAKDVDLVAQHQRAVAALEALPALKQRVKTALVGAARADEKARDLEGRARQLRADAGAAVSEARAELEVAERTALERGRLAAQLAQRGSHEAAEALDELARRRRIESAANSLAGAQRALDEVEPNAADARIIVEQAAAGRYQVPDDRLDWARRMLGTIEERTAQRDRLAAALAAVQAGEDAEQGQTIEPDHDIDPEFDTVEAVAP